MKRCNDCKKEKNFGEFSWERRGEKRSKRCKDCQKIRSKKHYKENSEEYVKYRHNLKERNQRYIYNYLKNNPCINCGETNPIVLEFDHIDPKTKEFGLGAAGQRRVSIKKIQEEINKCVVLCANCHRIKTSRDRNYYCYKFLEEEKNIPR